MPDQTERAADPVHGTEIAYHPFATGWDWWEPHRGEHFRRCTYCGSIHPDDLAAETTGLHKVSWADMKHGFPHKVYLDITNRNPEQRFIIGATPTDQPSWGRPEDWVRPDAIPEGVNTDGWTDLSRYRWIHIGTRPHHNAKFYTEHLRDPRVSDEVRDRIHQIIGLRLDWTDDGRVRWHRYDCTEDHPHE
jgi:hypothetical protein